MATNENYSTEIVTNVFGLTQEVYTIDDKEIKGDPEIDELKRQIKDLQKWISTEKIGDEESYLTNYENFKAVLNIIKELQRTHKEIRQSIEESKANNVLKELNNPESGILGFKFSEKVMECISNNMKIVKDLKDDDKTLFEKGLGKLVKGVADFVSTNSLLGNVISFAASFVSVKEKDVNKQPFDEGFINEIKKQLKPFVVYYSTLQECNVKFSKNIGSLESRYVNLGDDIDFYIKNYIVTIGVDLNRNIDDQVTAIFDYRNSGNPSFDFRAINRKNEVKVINSSLFELREIINDLNNYYRGFRDIVLTNFSDSLSALDVAKGLGLIDVSVHEKISEQLSRLTGGNDKGDEIKINFGANITSIKGYVNKLNLNQ